MRKQTTDKVRTSEAADSMGGSQILLKAQELRSKQPFNSRHKS
ncbi:hypothetical protein [Paenibacillus residui]|uniref:Uncharacterized protein n=1 Tax=Paenibacillus residui TaxID=629724 RepID=A0ABW3D621_9BACL